MHILHGGWETGNFVSLGNFSGKISVQWQDSRIEEASGNKKKHPEILAARDSGGTDRGSGRGGFEGSDHGQYAAVFSGGH